MPVRRRNLRDDKTTQDDDARSGATRYLNVNTPEATPIIDDNQLAEESTFYGNRCGDFQELTTPYAGRFWRRLTQILNPHRRARRQQHPASP